MSWWVAGRDHGNGQAYVFQAPTLATAKQEAQGANSLLTANGGPYATRAAAQAAANADNGKAGGGSPAPPGSGGGSKVPMPGKLSTFGEWKNWIDSRVPGQGDVWIAWVESHAKITPPESDTVDLSSNVFPAGGTFLQGNASNHAINWFAAWILEGNVGPDIAKILAGAIGGTAAKIPGVLKDVGTGISKVPGAQQLSGLDAVGGFFSNLTQANTWIRVAEVLIGIALIGIGVARITGAENAVSSAVKNIKVIPV